MGKPDETVPEPALFLCRSPFQAMLIEKIVSRHAIERYDIVYYNQNISAKDILYFDRLRDRARSALLFSRTSISGWAKFLAIVARTHGSVFIANHTFSAFRLAVSRKTRASIFSFDEGAGNFDPGGALQADRRTRIERWRDRLMTAPPATFLFGEALAHYTVDARLPNVVPPERLRQLDFGVADGPIDPDRSSNLLIGQPFSEYLSKAETGILYDAFRQVPAALYVPHPREQAVRIPADFKIFEDERILEEVVLSLRSEGRLVRLIGCDSTILASMKGIGIEKYSLEVGHNQDRIARMREMGCETFDLNESGGRAAWQRLTATWHGSR